MGALYLKKKTEVRSQKSEEEQDSGLPAGAF
jgi:hypothetical protein